jgi:hypothetical protein
VKSTLQWLLAAAAAILLCACGGKQSEVSQQVKDRSKARAELRGNLTGTWARHVRTDDSLWEGIRFDSDGRFGLFGIHTLYGLQWLVRGDSLVLTTSAERYAQPEEIRLEVQILPGDSLVLSAAAGYLPGIYGRVPGMARRLSGTVNYREKLDLGRDAALYLELRAVQGDGSSKYLASQTLSTGSGRAPFPFHIYYASADAAGLDSGFLLVTLVVDGLPRLNLESGFKTDLKADADSLEVWLEQPES